MPTPDATILITTYNRKGDLGPAVETSLAQRGCTVEVLVVDDASPDGSADYVRGAFPGARVHACQKNQGYIVNRNLGAQMASAPVIISIDDDAVFPSQDTVAQTLTEFDEPRVGAVAIPYIDVKIDPAVKQVAPDGAGVWVTDQYRGTAHALRRELFLKLGGYRTAFQHQSEEGDYCVRMMGAGYVTRLGRADPIHHLESPKRSRSRVFRNTARNAIWMSWYNVPMPALLIHLPATAVNLILDGIKRPKRLGPRLSGVISGLSGVLGSQRGKRSPVPMSAYRLWRELRKGDPQLLGDVLAKLPGASD